jgi:hypothetical protein
VELLPELHRIAEKKVQAYKSSRQQCFAVECMYGNARDFVFPAEPTVLYLFNPFPQTATEQVAGNLAGSMQEHPWPVFVLYHNPHLEHLLVGNGFLSKISGTHQYSILASCRDQGG